MKSLLIIAHGSRRSTSNQEVLDLAKRITENPGQHFDFVSAAFLEIAEPSIPVGLEQCIAQGASEIMVLPYFLTAGRHVVEDVPAEVKPVSEKYPHVTIKMLEYLGASDEIPMLIINSTKTGKE